MLRKPKPKAPNQKIPSPIFKISSMFPKPPEIMRNAILPPASPTKEPTSERSSKSSEEKPSCLPQSQTRKSPTKIIYKIFPQGFLCWKDYLLLFFLFSLCLLQIKLIFSLLIQSLQFQV